MIFVEDVEGMKIGQLLGMLGGHAHVQRTA